MPLRIHLPLPPTSATQEPALSTPVSNKPGESSGKCGVLILLGHCNTKIEPFEESSRLSAYDINYMISGSGEISGLCTF